MNIEELKQRKEELETKISNAIYEFQAENETCIKDIKINFIKYSSDRTWECSNFLGDVKVELEL